jgi:hypothetical protein
MTMTYYCKNYDTCRGMADGADRLCAACREADRQRQEELKIDQEYFRLNQKPRGGRMFEVERGRK